MALCSVRTKRKHKTLTLNEKMKILNSLDEGESMAKLAKQYGIGRATVQEIKKKRSKIMEYIKTNGPEQRRTLKFGICPKMENCLYTWYLQQRAQHMPVSGGELKTKAIEFYKKINNTTKNDEFLASKGWIYKFKKRFGISMQSVSETKSSSEISEIQSLVQLIEEKIDEMGLTPDQVYKIDESRLFWKMLPQKAFMLEVSASERKLINDRIAFMSCANASGKHKFDLMVIGRANTMEAFKNKSLPVFYRYQANAWVTREIFSHWFQAKFIPEVRDFMRKSDLPERALLIMDNSLGYTNVEDLTSGNGIIRTLFLPPNCTSLLQPMDQNVIQMIKSRYKKKLLIEIIAQDGDIRQRLTNVNLKDVVYSLAQSWNSISASTIRFSWKELWPSLNEPTKKEWDEEDNQSDAVWMKVFAERKININQEELNAWFNETHKLLTDDDICNDVLTEEYEQDEEEKDDKEEKEEVLEKSENEPTVKNDEALQCFTKCITWAEENDASFQEIMVLKNLREKVLNQRLVVINQEPITDNIKYE